ncbi:MAG: hypothetical protein RL637_1230 [Pseudomonadota bacterium]|jgi:16S rRNA (uracil1498-N3)-methyltransferase
MRISRLYLNHSLQTGQLIHLDQESAHYLRTVLRLKIGAELTVFNGLGGEYQAELIAVNKSLVQLKIIHFISRNVESNLILHLALGISRGERMDFAIQKAVELGVYSITPLITERVVVDISVAKQAQKLSHWQKIAQHASEQCGRTIVPIIKPICLLKDWLIYPQGLKIFLDPTANQNLNQLTQPIDQTVYLLSGAEGGFSPNERQLAQHFGFMPIRLGSRILRTETAVLTALAAIQTLWGDFV